MKSAILPIGMAGWILGGLVLTAGMSFAQNDQTVFRRYPVESAIIEYMFDGAQYGGETLYFDHWGDREARHTKINKDRLGVQNLFTFEEHEWKYTVDLDKKVGKKEKNNRLLFMLKESERLKTTTWFETLNRSLNGEKTGEEMIAGKMCEIWTVKRIGTVYWLWNGIPLKQEIDLGADRKIVIVARKISEGVSIPEECFTIPKDTTFIEGNLDDIIISLGRFVPGHVYLSRQ